jgi:phosphoglycolate phosphatase-like HAD superfamily hydrolase
VKLILFDLGQTLEDRDVLLPGALETLEALAGLGDGDRPAPLLGLVSDYDMPTEPGQVPIIEQRYYALLERLGIRTFFEPVAERVTLSTQVGASKPDESVFRAAVVKADAGLRFRDVLFVTENRGHVEAARRLGLAAVHLRGPGQPEGEIESLAELVPLVRAFLTADERPTETVVVSTAPGDASIAAAAAAAGVAWTRLGDVTVLSGPPVLLQPLIAAAGPAEPQRSPVPAARLHLVTQIGRIFQQEHPDVPVVVDKGRFLVVDLDPGARDILDQPRTGCFAVRPLPADAVVFDQRAPAPSRGHARAAELPGVTDELSPSSFEADLKTLVGFRTRHSTGTEFLAAVDWAQRELTALGYATRVQTVPMPVGTTRNLIADRPGGGAEPEIVIVAAHLDSVNLRGGPAAAAPGADDNASGTAGVLAVGRALAGHTGSHDLRLILFGGEEQGLFGSLHYVAGLDPAERNRIRAVVNMDMIAARNATPEPSVLLEGAAVSQGVIDGLAAAALAHTSLVVQTSLDPFNSDHVPFLDQGVPAVLTIEGADGANEKVHTERDTLEFIDHALALEILRMNVAFLAQVLH